jgi:hypothetical protein
MAKNSLRETSSFLAAASACLNNLASIVIEVLTVAMLHPKGKDGVRRLRVAGFATAVSGAVSFS